MNFAKVLLAAIIGGAIGAGLMMWGMREYLPGTAEKPAPYIEAATGAMPEESEFTSAIARAEPAVVSVEAEFDGPAAGRRGNMPFIGRGSGIIIDGEKGHIITNSHVVRNAKQIRVRLTDGRQFKGKLLGKDDVFDLALLKVNGTDLPTAVLGHSDDLAVGTWVVAIGNPLAFERSVTAGIISGKERYVQSPRGDIDLPDLLQTDAAINPGNSGGALVNLQGEVVGIPTVVVRAALAEGLGFAVPVDRAKQVVVELLEHGRVRHPWIGIIYSDIPPEAEGGAVPADRKGAYILGVAEGSPAQAADLREGDVVRRVDGEELTDRDKLHALSRRLQVEQELEIVVWRDGQEETLTLKVGEMPDEEEIRRMFESLER